MPSPALLLGQLSSGMLNETLLFSFDVRDDAVNELHSATGLYTATAVVNGLLDRVGWPADVGSLLDPSCGDGAFLIAALARMDFGPDDTVSAQRVQGWEIHPGAVLQARARVLEHLMGRGWTESVARESAERMVVHADFLLGELQGQFDYIVGNPPYLRFANLPEYFRNLYASILARHTLADIMYAFIDRCCLLMPENGVLAMVTADRWLFNENAAALRQAIGARVGLDHVCRLDASSSFYQAKTRRKGTPPRVHPVEVVLRPGGIASTPIGAGPISPDGVDTTEVGPTLGDIAEVRCGPWLAKEGIFVVDDNVAEQLRGQVDMVPAVDTDDIDPQVDHLRTPRRFALLTDRKTEPTGQVREHFLAKRHLLPTKCRGPRYWVPPETPNLDLSKPSLLIPRIAKKLRVIPLPAGVLPVNHNLSVVAAKEGLSLEQLREVLVSEASQAWLERNAPRIDNGYYSIITTLLRRLPVSIAA